MMEKEEMTFAEKTKEGKPLTYENEIEGIGTVKVYGTWDVERLINVLLQYDSIRH